MTREQLIEDTVVRICAMVVGLQNGLELSTMCPQETIDTDIVPIKEALAMLGISEDAIQMHDKDGNCHKLDLASLPIGIPRVKIMELTAGE